MSEGWAEVLVGVALALVGVAVARGGVAVALVGVAVARVGVAVALVGAIIVIQNQVEACISRNQLSSREAISIESPIIALIVGKAYKLILTALA